MKLIKPVAQAVLLNYEVWVLMALVSGHWLVALGVALTPPLLVLLALPFAKWDADGQGDLPQWASWLSTPNQRLPGGVYEPAVAAILAKYGRVICSWYWLGVRNVLYGMSASFGTPTSGPWPDGDGYHTREGLWYLYKPVFFGKLVFKAGYRIYQVRSIWLAVPCCTMTKN